MPLTTDTDFYSRLNPYRNLGYEYKMPLKEFFIQLGDNIKAGKVTEEEVTKFLTQHKLCFDNSRTGQPSSDWWEQERDFSKGYYMGFISCSCECGPMNEPCNELGPGSKIDFTFEKKD